jgi:hypothetical protein
MFYVALFALTLLQFAVQLINALRPAPGQNRKNY